MSTPHTHFSPEAVDSLMDQYHLKAHKTEKIRKILRVETLDGDYALKPTRMSEPSIEFIQSVFSELTVRRFPVEPFIPTDDGKIYAIYEGERYLLCRWFSGREANFGHLGDLMFGAKLLARLHADSGGFPPANVPLERRLWGRWPGIFWERINQMGFFGECARRGRSHFDRIYSSFVDGFIRQAEKVLADLLASPYLYITAVESPRAYLCHHDFSDRNLLINPYDCRLLDFDYCIADLRLHDVANLILRLLRHDDWRADRARFALRVYHRLYPLSEEHLQVLHLFLHWPQDFWQVGLQYYVERLPWPTERFLKTVKRKIADEPARQRFLKEFPEENGVMSFKTIVEPSSSDFRRTFEFSR